MIQLSSQKFKLSCCKNSDLIVVKTFGLKNLRFNCLTNFDFKIVGFNNNNNNNNLLPSQLTTFTVKLNILQIKTNKSRCDVILI